MCKPLLSTDLERKKFKAGLCKVKFCRNKRIKHNTLCSKHKHQRAKELNPINYCYNFFRQNARRRGKVFLITLKEFKVFVEASGYMEQKGRTKVSLCIDRKDNNGPYSKDNIRAITIQQNSWKRNFVDYGNKEEIDCPF